MPRSKGFTMVELMVVLAILAVIMGLAVPAMGDFLVRQRVKSQGNEIMLAMAMARSEAVKRNSGVAVLPVATGWSNGWCVVAVADIMPDCNSVDRLRSFDALDNVTITTNFGSASAARLEYTRYGTCANCNLSTFKVTSPRLNNVTQDARCIELSRQGRPTIKSIKRDDSC